MSPRSSPSGTTTAGAGGGRPCPRAARRSSTTSTARSRARTGLGEHTHWRRVSNGRAAFRWGAGLLLSLAFLAACGGRGQRPADPPHPDLPVAKPTVCVGTHSLGYEALNELNALRVRCTRITYYVDAYEHSESQKADFFHGLSLAFSHDIKVLIVIHQVPDSWSAQDFSFWLYTFAAEVGPRAFAYQIGNEWDTRPGNLPVTEYNEWLGRSYEAIKQINYLALVVTAAIPSREFADGLTAPRDVYAVHLYGGLAEKAKEYRSWFRQGSRVWATEFGEDVNLSSEAHQLREWQAGIAAAHGYEKVFGYQLRTDEPGERHGIIRPDGTPRPVADWLRSRAWEG
jgi:hypothetical protein